MKPQRRLHTLTTLASYAALMCCLRASKLVQSGVGGTVVISCRRWSVTGLLHTVLQHT